jgi:hypothetical protein
MRYHCFQPGTTCWYQLLFVRLQTGNQPAATGLYALAVILQVGAAGYENRRCGGNKRQGGSAVQERKAD